MFGRADEQAGGLRVEVLRPNSFFFVKTSVLALNPLPDYMKSIHIREGNQLY